MTVPSQNASRRTGSGGDRARSPTDEDPFSRDKNPKRRKTESDVSLPNWENLQGRICARFGLVAGESIRETLVHMCDELDKNGIGRDETDILAAMQFLSQTICVLHQTCALSDPEDNDSAFMCEYCSSVHLEGKIQSPNSGEDAKCAYELFERVVTTLVAPGAGPLTVRALILLRRIVLHSTTINVLDYDRSHLCKWCSSQLYSPDNAVRVQAAKSLSAYTCNRGEETEKAVLKNRQRFHHGLNRMFESGNCAVQETSALVWTQLGMVVAENELEPMLQGLLLHLDSSHKPVRDVAISELRYLASWFGRTPNELFEPYWRTTAYQIVKHIAERPAVATAIANLFGMTATRLALRLQSHAIPDLLFRKNLAPISKIAELRGDGDELWPTLIDKANLTSILAFWVQLPSDVATLDDLMLPLQDLSARLGPASIREVMGAAAIPVLSELFIRLTYSVERIPDRFETISDGIGFAPILTIARLLKKDAETQSDEEVVTGFLSQHVLGLTTRLSDVHVYNGKKHLCHWIDGIEALEILIKYLRSAIRTARPQVTSFLLDALCDDGAEYAACWRTGVRRVAISCWATLVQHVGDENVLMLMETTFAVIRKNWEQFGESEKATCKSLLAWLLEKPDGRNHRDCLLDKIDLLPRLKIPELQNGVGGRLDRLHHTLGVMQTIDLFAQRIRHENLDVIWVALEEAREFLEGNQDALQAPAQGEKSDSAVAGLVRALLECSAKYSASEPALAANCLTCIGLVGCLDANRLGAAGKDAPFVVIWNFRVAEEFIDFVMYMLQHVLTRAFLSATNSTSQGLIAHAVQTLLSRSGISAAVQSRGAQMPEAYDKWRALPELVQVVLSPLLVSKYHIAPPGPMQTRYPIFRGGRTYGDWLRLLVTDLLAKPQNAAGKILYESLSRAAKGLDLAVAEFLLPYLVVYVVTGSDSTEQEREQIAAELKHISEYQPADAAPSAEREQAKLFYDAVFRVIEYAMVWLRSCLHYEKPQGVGQLERFLEAFPAEVLSQRAMYCRDYARAMFFLEPVAMAAVAETDTDGSGRRERAEADLIDIYAQIDDPDCLSGIMSKAGSLMEMNTHRKALLEQKAGRWESATTWYLSDLSAEPDNMEIQARVLTCFLEAGHHDALLARVDGMGLAEAVPATVNKVLPLALEAAWATFQWPRLSALAALHKGEVADVFNVGIARALCHLRQQQTDEFGRVLDRMVDGVAAAVSYSTTSSLQACHETMLKAHVVTDLRMIGAAAGGTAETARKALATVVQRLDLLEDVSNKRYVLGLQRAAMEAMRPTYSDRAISSLWLLSARLARKTGSNGECLKAIAHARQLNDPAAEVENARRQWAWGGRHQAIADLRTAIGRGLLAGDDEGTDKDTKDNRWSAQDGAPLAARAGLLMTRWLDASGETSRSALRDEYRELASRYGEWEKSHYFLGRHYKKVLESEQTLKPDEQSDLFLTGDMARMEIEHYLRAAKYGTKYLHTTLPRILTAWLALGSQVDRAPDGKAAVSDELRRRRNEVLTSLHKRLLRHVQRLPAFIFYTALPQLVARINHPNKEACHVLDQFIVKVVLAYPQQALWSVFGVLTARAGRGQNQTKRAAERLLKALCAAPGQPAAASGARLPSLQSMLRRGVGLADELVQVGRKGSYRANSTAKAVSLKRDMNFGQANHSFPFVVPIARCLTAVLPGRAAGGGRGGMGTGLGPGIADSMTSTSSTGTNFSTHNAFAADVITIQSFQDEVLILGSLAQPRKLTMRGSDGRLYDVLLKPKDDMRTDQRIMEVNALINQALRKDTEAMRRQLSIRTYAVTPLNEDCGIIEWVLGLKTLREIVRPYYDLRRGQVQPRPPDPLEIVRLLNEAETASRRARVFTTQILPAFPPVLHEWFMRRFPYPAAWFAARLRFTRSAAVMSMVGAVLGLGDRHCENVLVEEGTGAVMHVDFNCLFEKGRLFTQPETVPFRLTQNMRAVMGICDHRGPFRRSCELTLRLLREQEETLLAVLEAFIHDPTLDLQVDPRHHQQQGKTAAAAGRPKPAPVVRLDPPSVVKNIKRRMNGLLLEETIPLGVEGQAWELIKQATDPQNLSAMYIGWSPHW
ncbi:inositol kinase kinase [Grosmannia clavigera kw1407]|uniref:non-specific serine/threonine protein kinase n=1 Tax=Grosmannia clavigera (strain kw1407 / UAMH 11150) TaxID=655863 RepID=F0XK13_GROCL|nr:inositol kinase kinase [Grosmannia clavigera kw1407]EFX01973.1 inositol kinase kinase [Grosmannia clavigera kw1407]